MDGHSWNFEYALAVGILILVMYLVYEAVLPKPLPGIPYNHGAPNKIFGDIPEMMGYVIRTKRIFCWLTSLTTRHQSPIVQAFIKPMALPWVVVTDPSESQDILLRRTKEFDRSGFFGELIGGILPEQHIQFLSSDERFKKNRNLINHLMAPNFINQVSAPEVYNSVCTLIKVWKLKCDIAKGRPFSAHHDITYAALDSIFASSFGLPEEDSITIQNLQATATREADFSGTESMPICFPSFEIPEVYSAVLTLANSVTDTQLSPAPVLTSWVLRKFPYMRKATAIKDNYIRDKVEGSVKLIESGETNPRSAIHSVLLRERDVAAKENRQPNYSKQAIADEFFGFMMAGHDTSATTVAWGLKYLTDNPGVQDRLRLALQTALSTAYQEKRQPIYEELSKAHIPYLDAVVEEVLRHANTIAFVVRRAQQDTTVLGRQIPKGTDIFLMANGAGYLEPCISIADESRSPGARVRSNKALTGQWDNRDIAAFRPERWLKVDPETSNDVFDPMAGPTLAFGLGPRGCFGKRLALQHLKIQFSLIVWHFDLLKTPEKLSGYDAVQRFAREPTQCYIRLANVG
ncbi:cytochrome P450 [Truncatella angustata]|uniref:Cytochrome P450 n=1 Tax=Truncatella angustata TaxID=152316 RepID=A0A9P8ZXX2_9PEZI|nr:cytochrome P450 [Truncatella angustata]KAH6655386.1 cytochrome P450 [Truncatella angustata]